MRKWLSCFIVFTSLFLSACSAEKAPVIALSCFSPTSEYEQLFLNDLTAEMKNNFSLFEKRAATKDEQLAQLELLVKQKPAALLVQLANTEDTTAIVEFAKSKQLPLILFGAQPNTDAMKQYEACWYIGYDPSYLGDLAGLIVADGYKNGLLQDQNKDHLLSYVILLPEESPFHTAIAKSALSAIEDTGLYTTGISVFSTGGNRKTACEALAALLANPGNLVEAVICTDDASALGAADALAATAKSAFVVSIGSAPDAAAAIAQGTLCGSVLTDPSVPAALLKQMALNAANKRFVLEGTQYHMNTNRTIFLPASNITAQNTEIALAAYTAK